MSLTLHEFTEAYLQDEAVHMEELSAAAVRKETLPLLQTIIDDFIQKRTDLQDFRSILDRALRPANIWYAQSTGFMMEINKFSKNHARNSNEPQEFLRSILSGLNARNLGQRIEQFYSFLLNERGRLRNEGFTALSSVAPGNSAGIISLFAFWLDPESGITIYKEGTRRALCFLYQQRLVPGNTQLRIRNNTIDITTAVDHEQTKAFIANLVAAAPGIKRGPYWTEWFAYWIDDHYLKTPKITKEDDKGALLSSNDSQSAGDRLSRQVSQESSFKDEPLAPTPEPLLTELIRRVQRYILVEEAVIRRIYHALLAGHVILSGPPGTGKTELARLIPEILWQRPEQEEDGADSEDVVLTHATAYTTSLVTATDEWSVRTLISGIAPTTINGSVTYSVKYGYLTTAIRKNWSTQEQVPEQWDTLTLRRSPVTTTSSVERGTPRTFRGQWLVIDEFNRAPIDLALGDALTALGGNDVLRVAVEGGSAELPIPRDFRIIGTLNSFDRNYLNQISEALKRRFSFVEILPPGRSLRRAEQGIVLYKALEKVSHLSKRIVVENGMIMWDGLSVQAEQEGHYSITWPEEKGAFPQVFEFAWRICEIIRIYRQLGTAQAISLVRHMLIAGVLQDYTTLQQWSDTLDAALCDTLADQLQVLLPDEIDTLLLVLTRPGESFPAAYNALLLDLADRPQRLTNQLLALSRVVAEDGTPYLSDDEVEDMVNSTRPAVSSEKLGGLFHLAEPGGRLPQFIRRLRTFKAERGL